MNHAKEQDIRISDLEISKEPNGKAGVLMVARSNHQMNHEEMIHALSQVEGLEHIEEFM